MNGYAIQLLEKNASWGWDVPNKPEELTHTTGRLFVERNLSYCLPEPVPPICAIRLSSRLAWVVVAVNAVKLVVMLACCLPKGPLDREQPLLTIGDAISSFLRFNHSTTKDRRAMQAFNLGRWTGGSSSKAPKVQIMDRRWAVKRPWKRYRLFHLIPRYRRVLFALLLVIKTRLCVDF